MSEVSREDAVIFEKQLEYVKTQVYDEINADLKAFSLLPVTSEIPEWATEMTWRSFNGYGIAKFIADKANDYPTVEVGGSEQSRKIHRIGLSYDYSELELIRAAKAGVNLDARKAKAVARGIQEKLDSIAWSGDTAHNIPGFISYPGITEYTVPATGTGTTKTWSTKTSDQMLTDLYGIMNAVTTATADKERINTILLPQTQYLVIKQKRLSDYSEETVLSYFLKMNPGMTVDWLSALDSAGANSTDRFIGFNKSSDKLSFEVPEMMKQKEVFRSGVNLYKVPVEATVAGVIVYYPLSIAFGDGI